MDVLKVKQPFIAKNCARTANVQVTDPGNVATYLGKGELVITDGANNVLTTTTAIKAVESIKVVQRSATDDTIYQSTLIKGAEIKAYLGKNYAAAVEQVTSIGFDGVTVSSFTDILAADTNYKVQVIPRVYQEVNEHIPKSLNYKSGINAPTEAEIVNGIVEKMAYNLQRDTKFNLEPQAFINSAGGAITGSTVNLLFTQYSRAAYADTVNTTITNVVPGDYVKVAAALTSPTYKVKKVVNGTASTRAYIELDYPYQQVSSVVALATATRILALDASTAEAGLKLIALPYAYERFNFPYTKEQVTLTANEVITGAIVEATTSSYGNGTYEEVSDLEAFNKGYFGNFPITHPNYVVAFPKDVNGNELYDILNIHFTAKDAHTIENASTFEGDIIIAIAKPVNLDGTTTTTNQGEGAVGNEIINVLNKYCVTEYEVGTAFTQST